ncbi:uncharacterized protein [Nicotiana tomentosiformis]|uniref:uncharacterized protein n=1 Tax=Nicotiana tomentosiformis TaxID=4098 RepID=UPI00051BB844|nr:uncharacterized protein LOC104088614 [Nicotiana tomentosiformis]
MELEDRYGQPSGIRVYQVKKELASISQGSMNIPEYYARMKYIWDELSVLNVYSDSHCTCGGGKLDIQKREEDQKVYQFLMGLNEGYANAIRNLLMMSPFSTINKTYSLLVTDERQREIQPHSSQFSSESASFSVGSQRSFQKPFQKNFQPKTSFDPRRPSVVCSYCNKPDHTAERCYRKHGFPPNFQFTRNNRRIAANVQTELDPSKQFAHVEPKPFTETPPANVADTSTIPGLTNVQCSQLLTLLQQHHVSDPNSTSHFTASANFADFALHGYCDSDWAACPDSRKSVTGFFVFFVGRPVSWKSKKQSVVSLSSVEAEYCALNKLVAELTWLTRLLANLGVVGVTPVSVFYDNQSSLHIARNPVFHERTKHIEVDCHFVRENYQKVSLPYSLLAAPISWLIS